MDVRNFLGEFFPDAAVEVSLKKGRVRLLDGDFQMAYQGEQEGTEVLRGTAAGLTLRFLLTPEADGIWLEVQLEGEKPLDCESLSWTLRYRRPGDDLSGCLVPCAGKYVADSGLRRIGEKGGTKEDTRLCGLFQGARRPCVLLGTRLPQKNLHLYSTRLEERDTVLFRATTYFTEGQGGETRLCSERTLLLQGKTPLEALRRYGEHLAPLPREKFSDPLVGWNTWDYYFSALRQEDVLENARAIAEDPILSQKLKCLVVDMGWEHREGEWFANYRFPDGMEALTEKIRSFGLIPGVWTNGCQVQTLSYPALRSGEMFLKNEFGGPLEVSGMYVVDPTHPMGEEYLFETYSRLYRYGFRIFKVDFVDAILEGRRFHDPSCGPYDAIRRLFSIVRRAVAPDSHIIGCSYPAECGPGYTDTNRISVDIHNQWTHVRWILEYLQLSFWENGRLFRIDPDFLVVRGRDTSLEAETNVYNPFEFLPYEEGSVTNRWRRGPVFDRFEAETWANVVVFSGGNLILSDRLEMLNDEGKRLLYSHLEPSQKTAIPLDLGETELSALWYLPLERGGKLLLINHGEQEADCAFSFAAYGLPAPQQVQSDKGGAYADGVFTVRLRRHESAVLRWEE